MTDSAPKKTDWRVVALLLVVGIFAAWQFAKIALPLLDLAQFYQRDPKSLAFLVSVVGLVGATFGVVAGNVVAGIGAKRALVFGLMGGAVVSGAQAFLPSLPIMMGLRVLEGFSHLTIVVAAPTMMAASASDKDRPIAMGIWAMFFGIAFAIGSKLFPYLTGAWGLSGLFVLHGAGLAVLAAILFPILPNVAANPTRINLFRIHFETYRSVRLSLPGLGFVFYTATYLALLTYLPNAVARPEFAVTLPIISLFGTFIAGYLAKSFAPPMIAIISFLLTCFFAVLLWFGQIWAAYFVFFVQGAVPGASFAAIPFLNHSDEDRAKATGAIAQMGNIGTTFGPPLFALALGLAGLGGFFGLLIVLSLLGALVLGALWKNIHR